MYGSSEDTETIRQFIDISRVWLGVDEGRRIVRMQLLDEDAVLMALKEGSIAECGVWSIKVTPPRRIPARGDESEWAPGILAISVLGFASGLRIDAESVRLVCKRIKEVEQRRAAYLNRELEAEQDERREFDEG
jgi:hypothetical protein